MSDESGIQAMNTKVAIALPVQPGIDGNLRIYAADARGPDSGLLASVHKGRKALNYMVEAINGHEDLKTRVAELEKQVRALPVGWGIAYDGDAYTLFPPKGRGVIARSQSIHRSAHEKALAELASALINAAPPSTWTPCSKRLPDRDGCYDIWHKNGGRWTDAYFFEGTWLRSPEPPADPFEEGFVTHWMEQPDAPPMR